MSATPGDATFWERVRELFHACAELDAEARRGYLDAECGGGALRAEVESLLREHDAAGGFLDRSVWQLAADAVPDIESIGPYRVVRRIGEGGMGSVYLAARDDAQFEQRVAIKVVRGVGAGAEMLRRFRQERQILAALAHPNIARLLDGGSTADGLPYLVMEYVEGTPIDDYCRDRALPVPARLRLFLQLCDAVQYAHRNLIIHRDIKPGNVLVTGDGVPKLLDFGIAKLTSEATQRDATVTRLLTPDYASPEQLDGRPVSTASDVYSLGVLLFELLAGARPFHGTARGEPPRAVRGDLDRIVAMSLQPDPERRYGSVENFAADIRRYLDGHPISARKPSLGYRAAKFVRRNKAGVAAAALALAVGIGSFLAVLQHKRAAERRFEEVRSLAHSVVFDIHDAIAPLPGSTAARRLLVQRALVYLDALSKESADNTPLEMELAGAYERIGDVQGLPYRPNLGDGAAALTSYRKAQALAERIRARQPENDPAGALLAEVHDRAGLVEQRALQFAPALRDHEAARAIREALPHRGAAGDVAQARTWVAIGDCLYLSGDLAPVAHGKSTAQGAYETSLKILAALPQNGPHRRDLLIETARAHQRLGGFFTGMRQYRPDAALGHHRAALAAMDERARLEPESVEAQRNIADQLVMMATLQNRIGDSASALAGTTRALAVFRDFAAADAKNVEAQRDLAFALEQFGYASGMLHRWNDSGAALSEAMEIRRRLVAADATNREDRRTIAGLYGVMTKVARERGDEAAAERHAASATAILQELKSRRRPDGRTP